MDGGHTSSQRPQKSGIIQGCPLSPFLFGMVMTVLMTDAVSQPPPGAREAYLAGDLSDLIYADDTLLMSRHKENLDQLLAAIVNEGKVYGLELNWKKTLQMQVSTAERVFTPDGHDIETVR